jgi:beta-glucanase (GH16 family)
MFRPLCSLLLLGAANASVAGDVPPGKWTLTFAEECSGERLDRAKWDVDDTKPGSAVHGAQGLVSTRSAENIGMSDGVCHLTAKENGTERGFPWTTAGMSTRTFHQEYGYFEARVRYGGASGLNNAFWLDAATPLKPHYEIDINEGHFPNEVNMTVHSWTGPHTQRGSTFAAPERLSDGFHVYGLLWTPQRLTWFMDGRAIHSELAAGVRGQMKILLSTAVLPWAGGANERLNGVSMDIDWVRVYRTEQ